MHGRAVGWLRRKAKKVNAYSWRRRRHVRHVRRAALVARAARRQGAQRGARAAVVACRGSGRRRRRCPQRRAMRRGCEVRTRSRSRGCWCLVDALGQCGHALEEPASTTPCERDAVADAEAARPGPPTRRMCSFTILPHRRRLLPPGARAGAVLGTRTTTGRRRTPTRSASARRAAALGSEAWGWPAAG